MTESLASPQQEVWSRQGGNRRGIGARIAILARRYPMAFIGILLGVVVVMVTIVGPFLDPYDPTHQDLYAVFGAPSRAHLLGTDSLGRDILSRVLYGSRVSIGVGLISVIISMAVGLPLGLVAGYLRGWVDDVEMRVMDALLCFPALVLALAITAMLGPNLINAMIAISIVFVPTYARLVRGQALVVRELEFVQAARSLGAPDWRIMIFHVLPNVIGPAIVQGALGIGFAILAEAGLSFLGLGIQPPAPSWGSMLKEAYPQMARAPWPAISPGAAIFLTVLAFNFVGDGLRDALDPRLRGR